MRVFLTGASGQLGAAIVRAFDAERDEVAAPSRARLDITNHADVLRQVAEWRPDVIVNCAAFNDVDAAEDRPVEAFAANAFAVRSLARAAEDNGAALVHYSTDFVFDGSSSEPYTEDAEPAPQSTYSASKLLGEWFALDAPRAFVLRVESLFGTPPGWTGRRGSLERIVEGLETGAEVRVFTDKTVSPSYVYDVAAATRHLLTSAAAPGLYHCVNAGHASWEGIAREAARLLGVIPRLIPTTLDAASLKARRPQYGALATGKLAAAGFSMPHWSDALTRWLASRTTDRQAR